MRSDRSGSYRFHTYGSRRTLADRSAAGAEGDREPDEWEAGVVRAREAFRLAGFGAFFIGIGLLQDVFAGTEFAVASLGIGERRIVGLPGYKFEGSSHRAC